MYKKINLIKIEFAYQKDERFFELKSHQQVQWYIDDVSVVIESFIIHTYEEQKITMNAMTPKDPKLLQELTRVYFSPVQQTFLQACLI